MAKIVFNDLPDMTVTWTLPGGARRSVVLTSVNGELDFDYDLMPGTEDAMFPSFAPTAKLSLRASGIG